MTEVLYQPEGANLELLTLSEAAERLRISKWGLYQLINKRQLNSITIGKRRLVTVADLDAYVDARREAGSF